jgi:hypothetical protein
MIQGYIPFTGANTWPPAATYQWCIRKESKLTPMMCSHIVFFAPAFFKSHCLFPCEFPKLSTILNSWAEKTMLVGQLPLQEGLLKCFGIFFKCLIWIDSPCKRFASILFVLSIFLLISHGFWSRWNHIVSAPILNRVTKLKRSFNCIHSHPSSDGNKNWSEGPVNPRLITLDRPHIW